MKKICTLTEAVSHISDGASVMIGGFGPCGKPTRLIHELARLNRKNLVVISNDTGYPGEDIGELIANGLVKRLITTHIGTNPETQKAMISGAIDVELVPQGTLAERIRAGGAGLGGVLTPTGVGTIVADGKPTMEFEGDVYLVERAIRADFALINARRADTMGNLDYNFVARNFHPCMAMAATTVIAEVEEIVPAGVIVPDQVGTPGVIVDYIVASEA